MAKKSVKVEKNVKKKKFNWSKVTFWLRSLINNGVCKELGIRYWGISILVFFVSIFISALPTLTTEATRNGSSAISGTSNDIIAEALLSYVDDAESNDLTIVDHKMSSVGNSTNSLVYTYTKDNIGSASNYRLDIYFLNTSEGNPDMNTQITSIRDNNPNLQSTIFFGTSTYQISVINPSTLQTTAATTGGYNHMDDISSFKDYIKEGISSSDAPISEKREVYLSNFYEFTDLGYLDIRGQTVGIYTGIILGVNAGITLIVVLIFFLMSRGKNNPNRTLKFYHCMGIGFHSTLSPALISMIVGYLMGGAFTYMTLIYVMCYGFRAMYLSMKYLRTPIQ